MSFFAPGTVAVVPIFTPLSIATVVRYYTTLPVATYAYPETNYLVYQPQQIPRIKVRIIFFGHQRPGYAPGFWCADNEVGYAAPPSRAQILGNLTYFASELKIETPIFAGLCKFYLTKGKESLTVVPFRGVVVPNDFVKAVELAERLDDHQFKSFMEEIRTKQYGAFIAINMDLHAHFAAQRCENESNPDPSTNDTSDNVKAGGSDGVNDSSPENKARTTKGDKGKGPEEDPQPGVLSKGDQGGEGSNIQENNTKNTDSSNNVETSPQMPPSDSARTADTAPLADTSSPKEGKEPKNEQLGEFNDLLL